MDSELAHVHDTITSIMTDEDKDKDKVQHKPTITVRRRALEMPPNQEAVNDMFEFVEITPDELQVGDEILDPDTEELKCDEVLEPEEKKEQAEEDFVPSTPTNQPIHSRTPTAPRRRRTRSRRDTCRHSSPTTPRRLSPEPSLRDCDCYFCSPDGRRGRSHGRSPSPLPTSPTIMICGHCESSVPECGCRAAGRWPYTRRVTVPVAAATTSTSRPQSQTTPRFRCSLHLNCDDVRPGCRRHGHCDCDQRDSAVPWVSKKKPKKQEAEKQEEAEYKESPETLLIDSLVQPDPSKLKVRLMNGKDKPWTFYYIDKHYFDVLGIAPNHYIDDGHETGVRMSANITPVQFFNFISVTLYPNPFTFQINSENVHDILHVARILKVSKVYDLAEKYILCNAEMMSQLDLIKCIEIALAANKQCNDLLVRCVEILLFDQNKDRETDCATVDFIRLEAHGRLQMALCELTLTADHAHTPERYNGGEAFESENEDMIVETLKYYGVIGC